MALGEWLSVNTARESAQRQIDTEATELDAVPEEEQEELALIYQAKGLPEDLARTLAAALIANKKTALDTLVREELGIDPGGFGGSAWVAVALAGTPALLASVAALALIGAGTTLFTGRSLWFSATRQLLVGLAAAGVTYGVGRLIGAAVTG
jgi:VIT1/CCC1 family predicted Fe2+/Mn2+ transporter